GVAAVAAADRAAPPRWSIPSTAARPAFDPGATVLPRTTSAQRRGALPRRPARQGAAGILGASNATMNIPQGSDRSVISRLISPVPGARALAGPRFFSLTGAACSGVV